ncbi:uncharacterized protein LOC119660129 [Hermetia illucens]|uniref:uncharacterized protein LOC119660129 n=1 Tax=Hermetia illucens TaxID=343691 RepID=UPI0018CC6CB1|nr:uncharacterized protein LOC119660129 [Hermetia illucens]
MSLNSICWDLTVRSQCEEEEERFNPQCVCMNCRTSSLSNDVGMHHIQSVKLEKYKKVIDDCVVQTVEALHEHFDEVMFQDDSAPFHRARTVTSRKEEVGIQSLTWPGNIPDLNRSYEILKTENKKK